MTFTQTFTHLVPFFAAKAIVAFLGLWLALLTGCASPEPVAVTAVTLTPTTSPVGTGQDAQQYAVEMGVTLEEALARLSIQNETSISILENQLQSQEAQTFAGLWLQHQPEYRVVVAFTRDGAETIRRYVTEDSDLFSLLELRPAQYSYAQLEADQRAVSQILQQIQQPAAVSILVMNNHVALDVTDLAAFEAALTAANLTLPESVVVNAVYQPVGENPPFAITPVPDVFMPQLKQRDVAFMTALLIGDLVVEEGCLRIRDIYTGESRLVIWQADYFLADNDGVLTILDETGAVVAQGGERVFLGGGEQPTVNKRTCANLCQRRALAPIGAWGISCRRNTFPTSRPICRRKCRHIPVGNWGWPSTIHSVGTSTKPGSRSRLHPTPNQPGPRSSTPPSRMAARPSIYCTTSTGRWGLPRWRR